MVFLYGLGVVYGLLFCSVLNLCIINLFYGDDLELKDHEDQIQSLSWKGDGSRMVTSCRDKIIRLFDVRAAQKQEVNLV